MSRARAARRAIANRYGVRVAESEDASEDRTGLSEQGPASQEGRAETAPLTRDNTRIEQSAAAAAPPNPDGTASPAASDQGTTRPTFPPPAGGSGTKAFPAPPPQADAARAQAPHGYHPTSQQPPSAGRPRPENPGAGSGGAGSGGVGSGGKRGAWSSWTGQDRNPSNGSGGGARKITPLGWTVRGLGLVAVAVVSGLLWLAVKPDSAGPPGGSEQPTKYDFALLQQVEGLQGCADVSNGRIKQYLKQHPCQHLTRALYTTKLPDGQQVLSSVTTVLMPDADSAARLNALTTKDKTGNINDLVDDGSIGTERYPKLGDAGYDSAAQGNLVAIGDSAYFGKRSQDGDPQLREVTAEALKKGRPQDKTPAR